MGTLRYTRRDVVDSTLVWRLTAKLPKSLSSDLHFVVHLAVRRLFHFPSNKGRVQAKWYVKDVPGLRLKASSVAKTTVQLPLS